MCSGGCDNCDFSHIFDNLSAGRAKWVAVYPYRQLIDGRDHLSPWAKVFQIDDKLPLQDTVAINKDIFIERMKVCSINLILIL